MSDTGRHRRTQYHARANEVFFWGLLVSSLFTIGAQNAQPEKNLHTIEQQLKEKQTEFQQITQREKNLLAELNTIDQQLQTYQQQLQKHQENLKQKTSELKILEKNLAQLQNTSQHKKTLLVKRLRAIYKMGKLGYLTPLLAIASYDNMQQQVKYLQLISEQDRQLLADVEQDRQNILFQKKALEQQKQDIAQTQKQIQQEQAKIEEQKIQKDKLLKAIQKDKTQYTQMIAKLETTREELEQLIKNIEDRPSVPSSRAIPAKPGKEVTLPENPEEIIEAYGKYFRSNKTKLLWPVQGKILTTFGNINIPGTKTYTHYKGVDIQAPKGTPFYAVFQGKVKYAAWFKGYGNLIILDHGGNYYTLYAHADVIMVKAGEQVKTRQLLGKVGDTDSVKGAHLYFEVRANGKPEDPQQWLAKLR
ncbi:hypothetical protein U27_01104 [Candidatus Vecturithrix granuli]|uniref:M23ase beta-sheet core domain-containing protein n=1 Tax=Vecturithrix granuli TaxID=1499967 RepID=A0A081C9F0_VECG1|nr:hypothetical protein U27_01104 [Candidatus Vecturithrix granuli]